MGEYAAFPYLCHKEVEHVKVVYEVSKPLEFHELYTPRDLKASSKPTGSSSNNNDILHIYKGEKSYWRTRDRILFEMYESRITKCMFVTCFNIDSKESYRTIFLDLESLYNELQWKAADNRDVFFKKKDKKIANNKDLFKAAVDYILARLMIKADSLRWPTFDCKTNTSANVSNEPDSTTAPNPTITACNPGLESDLEEVSTTERMCTFDKLSSDVYKNMEIQLPDGLKAILLNSGKVCTSDGVEIEHLKLAPTIAEVSCEEKNETKADLETANPGGVDDVASEPAGGTQSTVVPPSVPPASMATATTSNTKPKGDSSTDAVTPAVARVPSVKSKPASKDKPNAKATGNNAKSKINPKKVIPL